MNSETPGGRFPTESTPVTDTISENLSGRGHAPPPPASLTLEHWAPDLLLLNLDQEIPPPTPLTPPALRQKAGGLQAETM